MSSNIKLNFVYALLNKLFLILVQAISIPYLSRVLGPEKIGIHSFVSSIEVVFVILATFGIFTYGQREIARNRDNKELVSISFWNIYISSVVILSFFVFIWFLSLTFVTQYFVYYLVLTIGLIACFFDISWFLLGYEWFGKILIRNVFTKVLVLSTIFIFVKTEDDLIVYILIFVLAELLGNLALWGGLKQHVLPLRRENLNIVKYIKASLNYYISPIALYSFMIVDKIMIGFITESEYLNGLYEQVSKIIFTLNTLLLTLSVVLSPRLSYLFKCGDIRQIKEKIKMNFDFFLLLVYPTITGIIIISDELVTVFLGERFVAATELLCLLTPISFFVCSSAILSNQYVLPSGKLVITNKIVILGTICNIVGNFILIPLFSVNGAVISSLLSEFLIMIMYFRFCRYFVFIKDILIMSYKRVFACVIMYIVLEFFYLPIINPIVRLCLLICFGGCVYSVVLILLKDNMFMQIKTALRSKLLSS